MRFHRMLSGVGFAAFLTVSFAPAQQQESKPALTGTSPMLQGVHRLAWLPPGENNPRNSEGAFMELKDGRLFFAYSKFTGKNDGGDFGRAFIAGRYSSDGGKTWSNEDHVVVAADEAKMNVMSVSLLRLRDGRIALFYARKNSQADLLFYVRFSADETKTWSAPLLCTPGSGYFVMNNDRAVMLSTGRILLPVALHTSMDGKFNSQGKAMTYFSDDQGKTWKRSATVLTAPVPNRAGLQEPGVVELKDGRVMMFIRTQLGSQYLSYSSDHGDTWSTPEPSAIASPVSNAEIKRIPSTGDLLLIWNDHTNVDASLRATPTYGGKRTPVSVAISKDDGKTWIHVHRLLADPKGWYSYFAVYFYRGEVLFGFSNPQEGHPSLAELDLLRVPVKNLYRGGDELPKEPVPPLRAN